MIRRIRTVRPLPDFLLSVSFDDGKRVGLRRQGRHGAAGYIALRDVRGLFEQVQLDPSRTCVYWNSEIDLPSDAIYEYGCPQ